MLRIWRSRANRSGQRARRVAVTAALGVVAIGAFSASASAEEEAVTINGNPLTVYVGPLGQCQSAYAGRGNNFYNPGSNIGDCGFFLAFPKHSGQPPLLAGTTWGFNGSAGPRIPERATGGKQYEEGTHSGVSGAGTEASPYTQTTTFFVTEEPSKFARVTETTTYVNGQPQFTSTYTVKNLLKKAGEKIYFRAIYAGDLYMLGSDFGTGVFLGGPPRFVAGQNAETGLLGGFQEVPGSLWSAFQEGCWNETSSENPGRCSGAAGTDAGIWNILRTSNEAPTAFNNTVDPANIDNGAGVEWDGNREAGLEAEGEASFSIISRTQVPSALKVSPTSQTLVQGQTETVTVSATDVAGVPYAGKTVYYTVGGANPSSGSVVLNSSGSAQISYVGKNIGIDTIQMFVDLIGNGKQASGEPAGTSTVTFLPPNGSYKVSSIRANSNGTITITFVPVESGTGTIEVTVPTGTIARRRALAAKSHKCKKGLVKIRGKCRPKTTLSGKVSATGVAGVPLTITVKPSSAVTKALKKGRTVVLTATLTYKSALGGTPVVTTYHFTVKPPKKHHHH